MANSPGFRLRADFTIPPEATDVAIGTDGRVTASVPGSAEPTELGQLSLTRFVNPAGLESRGNNIYTQTEASGDPIESLPGEEGAGFIRQFALEASNVDPVTELVTLIKTQRVFEMNSQVIQAANETLKNISNIRAF
jgi:flagellar basal-body rod protein FlgG